MTEYHPIPAGDPLRRFLSDVTYAALTRDGRTELLGLLRAGVTPRLEDEDGRLVVYIGDEVAWSTTPVDLAIALDRLAERS